MFKLEKRTYTTAAWDRVVGENDPEVAFLVGIAGDEVTDALATQLGLATKNDSDLEDKSGKRKPAK